MFRSALAASLVSCLALTGAQAQDLDRTFYGPGVILGETTLRFCVYTGSPLADYERRLIDDIAQILLVEPIIHEVDAAISVPGLDFIPIAIEDLHLDLSNNCQAFIGVELVPDVYPQWMIFSEPYLESPYVLAVRAGEAARFSDLPPNARVSTQMLSAGDIFFTRYANAVNDGPRRIPYANSMLQIERLLDGSVDAAIIWEPWLDTIEPGLIEIIPADPIELPVRRFGFALMEGDTFLRDSLDAAIGALAAQ